LEEVLHQVAHDEEPPARCGPCGHEVLLCAGAERSEEEDDEQPSARERQREHARALEAFRREGRHEGARLSAYAVCSHQIHFSLRLTKSFRISRSSELRERLVLGRRCCFGAALPAP
jgi:hypothetical protein